MVFVTAKLLASLLVTKLDTLLYGEKQLGLVFRLDKGEHI